MEPRIIYYFTDINTKLYHLALPVFNLKIQKEADVLDCDFKTSHVCITKLHCYDFPWIIIRQNIKTKREKCSSHRRVLIR